MSATYSWDDGDYWYLNDKSHRDGDLPAFIGVDGTQEWYQHGKLHRDGDLPAFIGANGVQIWYQHDKIHRGEDKPAVMWPNGTRSWYRNGERHREENPAYIGVDEVAWYMHGLRITSEPYKINQVRAQINNQFCRRVRGIYSTEPHIPLDLVNCICEYL